ncbi:MAG: DUF4249 domain-containing protein [Flavobacteriales bacterium]
MNTKFIYRLLIAAVTISAFSSCEDVVDADLSDGEPQLTVDAFITDIRNPEVRLTLTQNYFDTSETTLVDNAIVSIIEGENVYELLFIDGVYTIPEIIVTEDEAEYKLSISHEGNEYEALSMSNPVPTLDSIPYTFEEEIFGIEAGFFAEWYARDIAGREDYYWTRYYRNDSLQNDPSDLIVSQDASFSGSGADGLIFITPLRQSINDFGRRYQAGEEVKVELWSIDETVFNYLNQVVEQTDIGGPLAIISPPYYNVLSNITKVSGPAELDAVGMFSVSRVSTNSVVFE